MQITIELPNKLAKKYTEVQLKKMIQETINEKTKRKEPDSLRKL